MTIRAAQASDNLMIQTLWNRMINETTATFTTIEKSKADISQMLADRPGAVWVVPDQGFITWGPFRGGPGYVHTVEHTIITAGPRAGLGRKLMSHALEQASAQGHHAMVGAISGENRAAIAFHAAMGFEKVGHMPQVGRKQGRWLDLVLMQKLLNAS